MNDRPGYYSPEEINFIFARLDPQDVERFYQSYQLWTLQQQIAELQTQITTLHQQIAENNERMQQSHPSAIALATLARLQSHDVTDVDLLDQMLARGEVWLDQTMQRLAYCEQFDFIRNNYTEWCQHALDGAYDWIDSMQNSSTISSPEESNLAVTYAAGTNGSLDVVTEEMLLQKLMSDEEAFMLETTLKRPAVSAQPEEQAQSGESTVPAQEQMIHSEFSDIPDSSHVPIVQALEVEQTEHPPAPEESVPAGVDDLASDSSHIPNEQPVEVEHIQHTPVPEESVPAGVDDLASDSSHIPNEQPIEVEHIEHTPAPEESVPAGADDAHGALHTTVEQAVPSEQVEVETVSAESEEPSLDDDEDTFRPRKKRRFLQRLFFVFFGR